MSENKTHYRKVFKSDHLGVADLEEMMEDGSDLILTIREVKQEIGARVAGRKGDHKGVKPWVLNAGNSKIVKKLAGGSSFVEDWGNLTVQLYIDHTASFGGEITGGVRVNPNPPIKRRQVITPENKEVWQNVKNAYIRDKNFNAITKRADMSQANQDLMVLECSNNV
jgi:hypothetical protein